MAWLAISVQFLLALACWAAIGSPVLLTTTRLPGSPFSFGNFSLTSSSQVLVDCEDADELVQSATVRIRNEDDSLAACGRGGDPAFVRGKICLGNSVCLVRNFTCCSHNIEAQEYGLATVGGRIGICKAVDDGWRTRLNLFAITNQWQPGLNTITGIEYRLGDRDLEFSKTQRYRVEVESEISSLTPQHFQVLQTAFEEFCEASRKNCVGERQTAAERQTGALACFSPPSESLDSVRAWLEASFPLIRIDIERNSALCVSPWSYFVPVAKKVFCVGLISSRREMSVLGANMLEGQSVEFVGSGVVKVSSVNDANCFLSELCSSSNASLDNTSTTKEGNQVAFSPTVSPTSPVTDEAPLVTKAKTLSPAGMDDQGKGTIFPTFKLTRSPTPRPTRATTTDDASAGTLPFPQDTPEQPDEETDITPLIWFGVGSGLTFLLNCFLFFYCKYCRGPSSQHKFTRLPGDVEMTAPSPPTIQVTPQPSGRVVPESTQSRPPLNAVLTAASAPFEQNPILAGGAAAFERAWNQGLIVDVWGITLKTWQPNAVVETLKRLRLLRVASGTVSGVEKMYWVAKQRPLTLSSPEVLGMIEISVDLTTKRLSAVFKMSRSAQTSTARDAQPLHDLFDAFKRVIEEVLC